MLPVKVTSMHTNDSTTHSSSTNSLQVICYNRL